MEDFESFWWKLWQPEGTAWTLAKAQGWAHPLTALTPFPDPGPVTVAMVRGVLHAWSARKAAGTEGWWPGEAKDWPQATLE